VVDEKPCLGVDHTEQLAHPLKHENNPDCETH